MARNLCDYLAIDVAQWLANEDSLYGLLDNTARTDGELGEALDDVRSWQGKLRTLLPEVSGGLEELSAGSVPDNPSRFIMATLMFAEFLGVQIDLEDAVLIPYAARLLTAREVDRLDNEARAGRV